MLKIFGGRRQVMAGGREAQGIHSSSVKLGSPHCSLERSVRPCVI